MDIAKDHIEQILAKIEDPISQGDLVKAGRVAKIEISQGAEVTILLRFPSSLQADQKSNLIFRCVQEIQAQHAEAQVHVHVETALRDVPQARQILPHVANIIAIGSGKGGVGKSTVSTNLAMALKEKGFRVGLLDADLYGPSIPAMLGLEGQRPKVQDIGGKTRIIPLEGHGISVMSIGFVVEPEQAVVLRGPRLAGIIKQFILECQWPALDYLLIDLPPGTGDIQLTLVQTVPVTGAVIVTTPQKIAVIDAVKALNMFRLPSINVPILGIVENMAWFTPKPHPDEKYHLFGQGGGERLAEMGETKLLGQIPLIQDVTAGGEEGLPSYRNTEHTETRRNFESLANELIDAVDRRNSGRAATEPVQIKG